MMWVYLLAIPLAALAAFQGYWLWVSVKQGVVRGRGVAIMRAQRPAQYWFNIILGSLAAFVPTAGLILLVGGLLAGVRIVR